MKKFFAILFAVIVICTCSLTALAAGTDDGSISVADRGGKKFFGTETVSGLIKYEAANGSGEIFYDLNGDKDMSICDLVALTKNSVDFDLSGAYDAADAATLRLILIGAN